MKRKPCLHNRCKQGFFSCPNPSIIHISSLHTMTNFLHEPSYNNRKGGKAIIYLDLIILVNVFCNTFALYLLKTIYQKKISHVRFVSVVMISALIGSFVMISPLALFKNVLMKGLISLFIVLIMFSYTSLYQLLMQWLSFHLSFFMLGGAMHALISLFQWDHVLIRHLFIALPIVSVLIIKQWKQRMRVKVVYDMIYDAKISDAGSPFHVQAFLDSGNQLYDPLTGKPVIIGDKYFFNHLKG